MPNKSNNAGHVPIRTCIICKKKIEQKQLLSFFMLKSNMVFDVNRFVETRFKYVCHQPSCLQALDKWLVNQQKKSGRSKAKRAV